MNCIVHWSLEMLTNMLMKALPWLEHEIEYVILACTIFITLISFLIDIQVEVLGVGEV